MTGTPTGVASAVSCLPLPPLLHPAFHLPRTAAGVSTGLACLRGSPTGPPDHCCWSQERAIETTEAHRICSLYLTRQRIKPQPRGSAPAAQLQSCLCEAERREAVDKINGASRGRLRLDWPGTQVGGSSQEVIRKVGCLTFRLISFHLTSTAPSCTNVSCVSRKFRSPPTAQPGVLTIYNFVQTPSLAVEEITPWRLNLLTPSHLSCHPGQCPRLSGVRFASEPQTWLRKKGD